MKGIKADWNVVDMKHLAFGVCLAFVLLGAFAGAGVSVALASPRWHVGEEESVHTAAVDAAVMPFYSDTLIPHRMPSGRMIDEDEEYLAHEKHVPFYKLSIPKHEHNKQIIRAARTQKSNYTFSLHGNVNLLWNYVNDERNARVDFDILDDVNGDGIEDVVISDCNSANKTLLVSGKDGSVIWSKSYPHRMDMDPLYDDANGDGIDDIIISWDEYNPISNETNVTIELLSGGNGEKIGSKKISYEGKYYVGVHGTGEDISGDGTEDILIEAWSWELDVTALHALNSKDFSTLWKITFNGDALGYYWTWNDLTGDGINDFAVRSYRWDNNIGELYVIRGSDGSVEWHKSFIGDVGYPEKYIDFDKDGLNDIEIENNDIENNTGKLFVLKGTDGSVIWSKSFNYRIWSLCYFSDLNGDGIEERCLRLENFTTGRVEEVQVLSGGDGSLIWKKGVNVSQVGHSKDLNEDGKDDILSSNSTEVEKNKYLYDVIAISGVDGSEIWKNSFSHDIEIEIPESEYWHEWSYPGGWNDLNGDGITDPLLDTKCWCAYWDINASTHRRYEAGKLILINGKDGSEIWDVECTADEDILLSRRTWIDFNNDGINDVLLGTGKGVYLLTISETSIDQPPVASFIYSPEKTVVNQTVTFNASSSYDPDGTIVSYVWNFGDGFNATGKVAKHSYTSAGDYTVALTVTDNEGAKNTTSKLINVSDTQIIASGALGDPYARKLARTSDGTLHCVYRRLDGSYFQIYHAYSTNGGQTWSEEQITTASRNHSCPSIAVDSKDYIHVVWSWCEEPHGFGKKCTVQYRVKTGTWQPVEDVITSYGCVCSIAVDSQDNIHLVVGGYNPGGYNTDYIKYLKRTPSGWSSPEKVSPKVWANYPAIAIDQNDNVHVVFRTAPYHEPLFGLYYRQRTADGWQSEETIHPPDQERSPVSVVVDSSGNVYVVWANYDTQRIEMAKRTSSGWEATEEVWHESGYPQSNPTIAIDSNDYLHVVWAGKHPDSPDYYQLRYRKYTTGWSPVQNLTSASEHQRNPNLIWAWWPLVDGIRTNMPKDGYAFVWNDNTTIKFYNSTDLAWETPSLPSPAIDVPFFSQKDERWKDRCLDNSPYNFSRYGCAVTSAAMVLNYSGWDTDPLRLNMTLTAIGGINENGNITQKGWEYMRLKRVPEEGIGDEEELLKRVDEELAQERPVMASVNTTKYPLHYIVFRGKIGSEYHFWDPADKEPTDRVWPNGALGKYTLRTLRIYAIAPYVPPIAGKGIWIVNISKIEEKEGGLDNVINRLRNAKVSYVAIKCGDGRFFWSAERRANPERIKEFHNAGIKVLGWQVIYGEHGAGYYKTGGWPEEEADVSNKIMSIDGIDGFIIDFEPTKRGEYEYYVGSIENATKYLELIRKDHPKGKFFIAYAPYARVYKEHKPYYLNFSKYCDAVMPQAYWAMRPTDPETEIKRMEEGVEGKSEGWGRVYDECTGERIPIIPIGQGIKLEEGNDVTGDDVRTFCEKLYEKGYLGVSLFRYYFLGKIIKDEVWEAYRDCFNSQLTIIAHSPVDIAVTDPAGFIINKEINEIPGATYTEFDINGDGHPDDRITILYRKAGDYLISVTPELNASPTDTYSLEVSTETETIILAENASVSEIPTKPYVFTSTVIFDTGAPSNPYPSIAGTHNGTIAPNKTIIATKLYTYPCEGTGGHTEYARIWNKTWNATATWEGYAGDWYNVTFDKPVVLMANKTYNYTIRTGSYPQIHHTPALPTANGWINCTKFTDANGRRYNNWIPAIRLWKEE